MARRMVEQTWSLDINLLRRAAYIGKPKGCWWEHRQKVRRLGIEPKRWGDDQIELKCGRILNLSRLPWRFGGTRYYFQCDCGRDVGKLYWFRGQPFQCRTCSGLGYYSQRATDRDRHLVTAQKIRAQLGGSRSVLDDFPPKPKHMHWSRYERLQRKHDAAANLGIGLLYAHVKGLSSRPD